MNSIKLQIDLLRELKKDPRGLGRIHEMQAEHFYIANVKGTALYRIPVYDWHLSENSFSVPPGISKLIVDMCRLTTDDLPLIKTGLIKEHNKEKYHVLAFEDGTNVYLDAKISIYFSGDVKYYKTKKPGMIKCVEDGEVVALIGEFVFRGEEK